MQAQITPHAAPTADADVIYIGDIVTFFLRRWLVFVAAIVLAAGVAVLYLSLTTPLYKASATVGPSTSSANSSKASNLALPFGLGAALGDGGSSTLHKQFLQTVNSYDIAALLAADKEMAKRIVEPKEGVVVTAGMMADMLKSIMAVNKLRNAPLEDTTFTEITLLHDDPAFAKAVLARIFTLSDEIIRRQVRESKTAQREVLLRSLDQTSNAYQRDALVKNLLEVEHELMTSQTNEPFSFRMIESLHAGERPASPRRLLILAGAMIAGAFIGFAIVCLMLFNAYRRNRGRIV